MRFFIDCEFNSMNGDLISMGLVTEDGRQTFYEVIDCPGPIDPWVIENVLPILGKPAITYRSFQAKLEAFLKRFPTHEMVADYPIDIMHFCKVLETGPGDAMIETPIHLLIDDSLSAKESRVPHNAIEDARAIRNSWFLKHGLDPN